MLQYIATDTSTLLNCANCTKQLFVCEYIVVVAYNELDLQHKYRLSSTDKCFGIAMYRKIHGIGIILPPIIFIALCLLKYSYKNIYFGLLYKF